MINISDAITTTHITQYFIFYCKLRLSVFTSPSVKAFLIKILILSIDPCHFRCCFCKLSTSWYKTLSLIRHAVDWIQEEGVVRVLLGKRGTVICTLSVPKTYPQEGSISLVSVHGGYGEEGPMELEVKIYSRKLTARVSN